MRDIHTEFAFLMAAPGEESSLLASCLRATRAFIPMAPALYRFEQGSVRRSVEDMITRGAGIVAQTMSPPTRLLNRATDAPDWVRRWNNLQEPFAHRHRLTIEWVSARSLRLGDAFDSTTFEALASGVIAGALAHMGYVVGFRGLRFESAGVATPPRITPWRDAVPGDPLLHLLDDGGVAFRPVPLLISPRSGAFEPLLRAVETDPHGPWRMARATELLAMSERTLRRRLEDIGLSFPQLINSVRIPFATEQILRGTRSLSWIAHEFGFYDGAHFTRSFAMAAGMSPRTFQRVLKVRG